MGNYCCDTWKKALSEGTDSEGFNSMIIYEDGLPTIGNIGSDTELPPLKYCPWCGAPQEGRLCLDSRKRNPSIKI